MRRNAGEWGPRRERLPLWSVACQSHPPIGRCRVGPELHRLGRPLAFTAVSDRSSLACCCSAGAQVVGGGAAGEPQQAAAALPRSSGALGLSPNALVRWVLAPSSL